MERKTKSELEDDLKHFGSENLANSDKVHHSFPAVILNSCSCIQCIKIKIFVSCVRILLDRWEPYLSNCAPFITEWTSIQSVYSDRNSAIQNSFSCQANNWEYSFLTHYSFQFLSFKFLFRTYQNKHFNHNSKSLMKFLI